MSPRASGRLIGLIGTRGDRRFRRAQFERDGDETLPRAVVQAAIIDARCALDAGQWRAAGWTVRILGRP